mgnify:CR=1 FL=1
MDNTTNTLAEQSKLRRLVNSYGVPRLIITGFLLLMFILAPVAGVDFATQITNVINRFSWNAIMVLAMVPMIHSGCGLNFGLPLGIISGLLGLLLTGQQLTMISMMGFIVLMGTVVNNGIVFVDYANQLRMGGMERRAALIATGKTRMRPILMTTLTTVLAMLQMVFSNDMASQLMSGMAIVIICGLSYATLMTLYIVPILYDILFKKPPLNVDIGSDEDLDDIPDDAAEFIAAQSSAAQPQPEA